MYGRSSSRVHAKTSSRKRKGDCSGMGIALQLAPFVSFTLSVVALGVALAALMGTNKVESAQSSILDDDLPAMAAKLEQLRLSNTVDSLLLGTNVPGIVAERYGATGDGTTDDTASLQAAIDAASLVGGKVFLSVGRYFVTSSLDIPAGVTVIGQGFGKSPTQISMDGTVIYYRGSEWAVRLRGSAGGLRDIAIYDADKTAKGGVKVDAEEGRGIESASFQNILIYNFLNGAGLQISAAAGGYVAYSSFYDIRIRHAKVGLHLVSSGENSAFVNSNSFFRGAISGGGFDYGLLVEGPGACNNNNFHGLVIEPYLTVEGHLVVRGENSAVNMIKFRLEGVQMDDHQPLIVLSPETKGSSLDGIFSGGYIDATPGAHDIKLKGGKSVSMSSAPSNLLKNANLQPKVLTVPGNSIVGAQINDLFSFWSFNPVPNSAHLMPQDQQLQLGRKVWQFDVVSGSVAKMLPEMPAIGTLTQGSVAMGLHQDLSFGFFIKVLQHTSHYGDKPTVPKIFTSYINQQGLTVSVDYSGSGEWELVGQSTSQGAASPQVTLWLDNSHANSVSTLSVLVTCPSMALGQAALPPFFAPTVTTAGAAMQGTLALGLVEGLGPASDGFLTLPPRGNIFTVSDTSQSSIISRVNHLAGDRFDRGAVIVLIFDTSSPGFTVKSSAYLLLARGDLTRGEDRASLSLVSLGDGTWIETARSSAALITPS